LVRELPPSNKIGKLFGIWMFGAYAAGFPLSLSIIASDVAGFTKKTTVSAVLFVAYCAGNIVGPQLFKAAEKPTYPTAFTAMLTCFCLAIGVITALRIVMDLQNKKRDKDQGVNIDPGKQDNEECQVDMEVVKVDETDWENRKFRYIL
jgi:MFS transporter, ACS family, allantoate permease